MKCIECTSYEANLDRAIQNLRIVERDIPRPEYGEVLIRMEAAPCNPSDLLFLQGLYGVKKTLPATPGWEGAGTVVESGGGLLGRYLLGKRVATAGQGSKGGTWAEYTVASVQNCIPLNSKVSFEQGATLIINPITAYGMVEMAYRHGHHGLIQTAAASQVGRMVRLAAKERQLPTINIIRRKEQEELLRNEGVEYILNSSDPDFRARVRSVAQELNATAAFEAVAGPMTGTLLHEMPEKAEVFVYGALSLQACSDIQPLDLIFKRKSVRGFWLTDWLQHQSFLSRLFMTRKIQRWMGEGKFETSIRARVGFDQFLQLLPEYSKEMTQGKVILTPGL